MLPDGCGTVSVRHVEAVRRSLVSVPAGALTHARTHLNGDEATRRLLIQALICVRRFGGQFVEKAGKLLMGIVRRPAVLLCPVSVH